MHFPLAKDLEANKIKALISIPYSRKIKLKFM